MARAIRASASSALIVHSEKASDSRKLDEGRMASSIFGCPLPAGPIIIGSKLFLQISNNPIQAGCVRSSPGSEGSCEVLSRGGGDELFASLCNVPAVTLENPIPTKCSRLYMALCGQGSLPLHRRRKS